MEVVHPDYSRSPFLPNGREKDTFKRTNDVTYTAGQFAVRVGVLGMGFLKRSVDMWAKDYEQSLPEGALVPEVNDQASTGAYIFETELVKAALHHQFDVSGPTERTRAGALLAQLTVAENARQEYMKKALAQPTPHELATGP